MEQFDIEDAGRLEFTQSTRKKIITDLLEGGVLPKEKSDKELLIAALDGMDRTVLAKTKIKSDAANQQQQNNTVRMISDVLSRVSSVQSHHVQKNIELPMEFIPDNIVPGEGMEGLINLEYDDFTS